MLSRSLEQNLALVGLEAVGDGARERPVLVAQGGDAGAARDILVRGAPVEGRDLGALRELVAAAWPRASSARSSTE